MGCGKTKCMPILLYGLDACPVSSRQLRSLNHVVVSCELGKFLMSVLLKSLRSVLKCVESVTLLTTVAMRKTNL